MDSSAHSRHDESLIARLFGDDVNEIERTRALELIANCLDCAALFAELGAIAAAAAAMPVPPRPRDFTLTEEDAARLRRARRVPWAFFGLGLRRSLGGSLAAVGLIGVILTSAVSLLGTAPVTQGTFATEGGPAGAQIAAASNSGADAGLGLPTLASAATQAPPSPAAAGSAGVPAAVSDGANAVAGPSSALAAPTRKLGPASPRAGGTAGATKSSPAAEAGQGGGFDARLVWLIGFGVLFAVGLAVTIDPWRSRRRGRAARP